MVGHLHAWALDRFHRRYARLTEARKQRLFSLAGQRILEIGAGTGANIGWLPPGASWTGVDPNPHGWRYIDRAARARGIHAELLRGIAEQLPVADGTFDTVVATLAFCSVRDPAQALEEVKRVLRKGGSLLFMEHVAAPPGSAALRTQRRWKPAFRLLGCTPDLDTAGLLRNAGFSSLSVEAFEVDLPVVRPHICGQAVR
jgi:ubiquinone/menaquinone biosynthesis C-methylase UbiE